MKWVTTCTSSTQGIFGKRQLGWPVASREQKLDKRVYDVPAGIDQEVARLKLAAMKIAIDGMTTGQQGYLSSWEEGT